MNPHSETWNEVKTLLREARENIAPQREAAHTAPVPVGLLTGTLDEFEEFLDHDELELAWEALAVVARKTHAAGAWHKLARAAKLMGLHAKEESAAQQAMTAIPADQALQIARLDAENVYQDLSCYRITVALEPDGWHVDYEVKEPLVAGGGPHYVIHPTTGAIVAKRYEQ